MPKIGYLSLWLNLFLEFCGGTTKISVFPGTFMNLYCYQFKSYILCICLLFPLLWNFSNAYKKCVFWTCYNCYKGNINGSNNFIPAPPFLFYSSLLRISAYADMGQLSLSIAEAEAQVWEIPNFEYWFTGIKSTNFSSVDSFTKFCTELRLQSVHH